MSNVEKTTMVISATGGRVRRLYPKKDIVDNLILRFSKPVINGVRSFTLVPVEDIRRQPILKKII